jgi:uncharacterized protein (DUF885 family)
MDVGNHLRLPKNNELIEIGIEQYIVTAGKAVSYKEEEIKIIVLWERARKKWGTDLIFKNSMTKC